MFFIRFVLFSADTVNDFLKKNCPYIAGAISFYTLFSIVPLFLAVISILGFVIGVQTEEEQLELAADIAEVIPVSIDFVSEAVQGVINGKVITGIVSVIGLLWAATAVFAAIRKGINAAWGISRTRPFLKERLIDFALVLGAGVMLLAVIFSGPALGVLREITDVLAPEAGIFNNLLWSVINLLVVPALIFGTFVILYSALPNTEVPLRYVWPVALLAALAFYAANLGFVWYVRSFALYNVIYGSVGAVLAFLTSVYLSAIILLYGALLSSRFTSYATDLLDEDHLSLKHLWTGFWRVRLRVVESRGTV